MPLPQNGSRVIHGFFHFIRRVHFEPGKTDIINAQQQFLRRLKRNINLVVLILKTGGATRRHDPDDIKSGFFNFNLRPRRILVAKQILGRLGTKHGQTRQRTIFILRKKSPARHLGVFHFNELGVHPHKGGVYFLLAPSYRLRAFNITGRGRKMRILP